MQPNMTNDFFELIFKTEWMKLKKSYPERVEKAKKQFVLQMSRALHSYLVKEMLAGKLSITPDVVEVIHFVFHFHYAKTGQLPDSERAAYQRSEEYREEFWREISLQLRLYYDRLTLKNVGTVFDPEIVCCDSYVDSLIRLAMNSSAVVTTKELTQSRFNTIRTLINDALALIKTVLLQMTSATPSHAIISWRALIEIEYKALLLVQYDGVLTDRFIKFGRFEELDEDADTPEAEEYRALAKADGYDPRHQGYKNYGWIVAISDPETGARPYPSFKSLLFLADQVERYRYFKTASRFSHYNASAMRVRETGVYIFLINQVRKSLTNLEETLFMLLEQYAFDKEPFMEYVRGTHEAYLAAYDLFMKNNNIH